MKKLALFFFLSLAAIALATAAQADQRADIKIDWKHYHNHAETTALLKQFAAAYPGLCKLTSIGKSFQGKDIWCLEITNPATGLAAEKPGMYIDGNTHAGEVSGAETCLYMIRHLLANYGKDPLVTKLVDTRTFYILPKINPDGSDAYLRKPGDPVDPATKKVDDDGDGLLDEDGPEDLNGDGVISQMRVRDEKGPLKTNPKDPRLMVQRRFDEKGEWRVVGPEGLDNDKDGRTNEDPPGGSRSVTNRNYPAYWAPEWVQSGSGAYPLSEPEAKAQVDFLLAHPNIAGVQAHHTHSGVILRPYCNMGDDQIPAQDMAYFMAVGAVGTELTGYPVLSVYNDFTTDKANPRHGVFVDWAYDFFGAFAFTTEIWKAPGETGKSAFDTFDELLAMQWNDKELGGRGFVNWTAFKHPVLGDVEIGGWNSNYFSQNPPPEFAEAEWKKNCLFELKHAETLPLLRIAGVKVVPLGDRLFRVLATVENEGYLPTNVTQKAIDHRLAKTVKARLELEDGEILSGGTTVDLGHIAGNDPAVSSSPFTRGGAAAGAANQRVAQWLVRVKGKTANAVVKAVSEKAGTASTAVTLK
jgi:murein tripeptide amidase MpaA